MARIRFLVEGADDEKFTKPIGVKPSDYETFVRNNVRIIRLKNIPEHNFLRIHADEAMVYFPGNRVPLCPRKGDSISTDGVRGNSCQEGRARALMPKCAGAID